jgi:hypothetical protein
MGAACSKYGRDETCMYFVGKPGRKRPFGRTRHRLEDNITTIIKDI